MSIKTVRIGGASGYWGDTAAAPRQLVDKGNVHYLVLDYLAEVTMAILARQRQRSDQAGYATDFVTAVMKPLLPKIAAKKIKVIANAGGVNLAACRAALEKVAIEAGITLKIGTVEGDDLLPAIPKLRERGVRELRSGEPLPAKVLSANAYLGAFPIAAALDAGADVVITGRCVDSALVLGPLIHEFGWQPGDFDKLAAGSLCGHILECGAQATGGNFTDWRDVADGWDDVGFPIAEVSADGRFIVTKPPSTGGLVSPLTVGEQMLYEIGDPGAYILPDVVCDFRQVRMSQVGPDRVLVEGARGHGPTNTYKVSATYLGGFGAISATVLAGFDVVAKAHAMSDALFKRMRRLLAEEALGDFKQTGMQIIGAGTLYGNDAKPSAHDVREVVVRLSVRHEHKEGAELFARELVGTGLSMATGRCGLIGGRPSVSPEVRLYSFLAGKDLVAIHVRVDGKVIAFKPALMPDRVSAPAEIPTSAGALPAGPRIDVPLIKLAVARSGDKGNDANIGVMARRPEYVPAIRDALTSDVVKRTFAHYTQGAVERFELPGTNAFNFLLHDTLGGGGTSSVHLDVQAKTYAQLLLSAPISVPKAWANELGI